MLRTFNKTRIVFVFALLLATLTSWAQTNKEFSRFYFKLSSELEFSSPKAVLNHSELVNLNENYVFEINNAYGFTKAKIENLSRLSKTNFTLKNTFRIEGLFTESEKESFLETLKNTDQLLYAYSARTTPIAPPHDIAPITNNLENTQDYIESDPGHNIRYAWNNGVNGAGINIRAIEYGVNLNHEELDHTNTSLPPNTTINASIINTSYTEHGTSVAGIIIANKGTYGISGLAHGANEYILYPEWTEEYDYNRVLATSNAVANSTAGDLIIYEMQTYGQNDNFVLAEYEQAIWDLTKAATDAGIVIVAAAGNGSEDLDDPFYNNYHARGDSGAIIVGAGIGNTNHAPSSISTYGSRVNIQSWGTGASTIGYYQWVSTNYGDDFNQSYITNFNGTSSATAIIGGFTAVLQSYALAQTGNYSTSQELRTLMVNTGIPQGSGNNIGPFPNMQAAMLSLDNTLSVDSKSVSNFIMYPNPTNGVLNINLNSFNNAVSLEIHNLLGQQVFTTNLTKSNSRISVNNLSKGLYLVTVKTSNTLTTKKLIIN
ncbi:S8/S53 family peptidase [uncultured Lacinutrix sp.]|uniref:S8/S53 family peptidase n=1 Tax=uncultured Lacinutrix sp. TaxID=574032 RepID=UPI002601BC46|nr:S8/S53 family peptidase [uncultured Lacinutrix sp.]